MKHGVACCDAKGQPEWFRLVRDWAICWAGKEKFMRLTRRDAMIATIASQALPALAQAQVAAQGPAPSIASSERPVRLIAPFSEAGAADIAARRFARHAQRHLAGAAHPILVENMPGASGARGTAAVARAEADGNTLLLARVASSAILPAIDPRTPYRVEDFTWLGLLDANPFVICVAQGAPWPDLPALLAALHADARPRLRFATSGPATILDLGVRKMFVLAGLPLDAADAVATRGGGDALAALLAGEAEFVGNNLGDMMQALSDGRVRALAVSGAARLPLLPGVPTTTEAGLPEMAQLAGWSAIAGPAHLPEAVGLYWRGVIARTGADPAWIAETEAGGSVPRITGGAGALAHVRAQIAFYQDIARRLNLG
jgi:tripartite-type tricarboxylate transporter receptor subunit TctC